MVWWLVAGCATVRGPAGDVPKADAAKRVTVTCEEARVSVPRLRPRPTSELVRQQAPRGLDVEQMSVDFRRRVSLAELADYLTPASQHPIVLFPEGAYERLMVSIERCPAVVDKPVALSLFEVAVAKHGAELTLTGGQAEVRLPEAPSE